MITEETDVGTVYRTTFQSPHESCGGDGIDCRDLIGKPFTITKKITREAQVRGTKYEADQCVMPLYLIEIAGQEIMAWPEEVEVGATWFGLA